ncbi:MAG: O-antigen ligase family protein, partial [Thermoanaerobaculia bacterium]
MIRHRGLLVAAPVAALVLWAPWWFGSVTPWGAALLEAGFAATLALGLLVVPSVSRLRTVAVPAAALLLLGGLALAQSLAWPPAVASVLSPEHARLAAESAAALEGVAEAEGELPAVRLSLAPEVSRRSALRFAALAVALLAAVQAGTSRAGRRLVLAAIVVTALVQILFGAPRWLAGAKTLFGAELQGAGRLRGTFINPNHFAELLEIAVALAFAWGWWGLRKARRAERAEVRVAWVAGPVLAWLTLFAALAFTGSRAGLLAAVAGTVVQGLLAAATLRGGRRRQRLALAGAGAVVAAAGVALVVLLGARQGVGRLAETSAYEVSGAVRFEVHRATLELWQRFPLLGTGAGTFYDAFPLVQPDEVPLAWRHAHSDPLELLATTGLAGAGLFAVGLGALLLRLAQVLRRGARSEHRAAALAALGALAAVGLHETVEFGLTIPAVAFTLAVLAGVAASAPPSQGRPGPRPGAPAPPRGDPAPHPPASPGAGPRAPAGGSPGSRRPSGPPG